MIVLRAIFWVAVAVILIPRDPNLGIATPKAALAACGDCQFSSPAALRDALLMRLYQVKADLAAKETRLVSK